MHDGSTPLLRAVHARGSRPALVVDGLTLSFAELDDRSAGVAAALAHRGLGKGDRAPTRAGPGPRACRAAQASSSMTRAAPLSASTCASSAPW